MNDYMITTLDNPFNPYEEWDEWWQYDHQYGHCSWELVDRLANTSDELPDSINEREVDKAIQLILDTDFECKYVKVTPHYNFERHQRNSDDFRREIFNL